MGYYLGFFLGWNVDVEIDGYNLDWENRRHQKWTARQYWVSARETVGVEVMLTGHKWQILLWFTFCNSATKAPLSGEKAKPKMVQNWIMQRNHGKGHAVGDLCEGSRVGQIEASVFCVDRYVSAPDPGAAFHPMRWVGLLDVPRRAKCWSCSVLRMMHCNSRSNNGWGC